MSSQHFGDYFTHLTAVGFTFDQRHKLSHDFALVRWTTGTRCINRLPGSSHDLIPSHLLWKVAQENSQFRLLLGHEIITIALPERLDTLPTTLCFSGDDIEYFAQEVLPRLEAKGLRSPR